MKAQTKILLVVVILLIAILACESNSNIVVKTPDSDSQSNNAGGKSEDPLGSSRSNPAPVGSKVEADDMKFSVLGSTRPATDIIMAGNMFNTEPEEGQEYILVELSVTCMKSTDGKCSISTFSLSLLGSKGVSRDAEWFVSGVDGLLEGSEFYGGATVTGMVPFIVDQDETDILIVYEPLLFGDTFYLAIP